jgi:hypothetical protein
LIALPDAILDLFLLAVLLCVLTLTHEIKGAFEFIDFPFQLSAPRPVTFVSSPGEDVTAAPVNC